MFTPQQIDQISFKKVAFGGYDMDAVDEFLEPLTEDYVTLYKENALLKSKMRVLVGKLEEYRKNEASMKDAILNAQKTCDMMVKEAEAKCAAMLKEANAGAVESTKNADAMVASEEARVEDAKRLACTKIEDIQAQIRSCLHALDRIKEANYPASPAAAPAPSAFDYDRSEAPAGPKLDVDTEAVANEIAMNVEALVGTTEEHAPKAAPRHPVSDTTSKFANLQFGRNYDPTGRK